MLNDEYLAILQIFVYALNMMEDKERAERFFQEANIDIILEEINHHRKKIGEKQFFYMAGRAAEHIIDDSQEDVETFNRMCGALSIFEKTIGLEV